MQFFGIAGLVALLLAALLATPVLMGYFKTGLVPRLPTLVVAVGLAVVSLLSFVCGLILDTVARARLEQRRLAYLALEGPEALARPGPVLAGAPLRSVEG